MVAALYRRYRPENFAEMIGQQQVAEPLMTALRTGRINHAYLFSGPRGCGKTSSARILARCLNCVQGPTPTPCGECESCRELGRGGNGSLDVIEIDAASHGGVDDARELRERAITAPARDRYKIFIIDEAHMVTPQGFNALLKVVEEPPEHVLFIFATTEPEKVISTIRSRTHHYPFRLIPPATMLNFLGEICEQENVTAESGVLPLVVRAGGGSARDTLSLLDQLIAGTEGAQMRYEMASQLLGFTSSGLLDATITALADGDAAEAYGAVDDVIQSGQDPRRFVEDLLERVRDLIVAKATGDGAGEVMRGLSAADLGNLRDAAARFTPAQLSAIAEAVNTTLSEMSGVTAPRLQLELMIARILVALRARFADAESDAAQPLAPGVGASGRVAAADREASRRQSVGAAPQGRAQTDAADALAGREAAKPVAPEKVSASAPGPVGSASVAATAAPAAAEPEAPQPSAAEQAAQAWAAAAPAAPAASAAPAAPAASAAPEAPASAAAPAAAQAEPAPGASRPGASQPGASQPNRPTAPSGAASASHGEVDLRRVRDAWPDVLELVLAAGGRTAWSVVERVEPIAWQGNSLLIEVPNRGLFDQLARKDARGMAPGHYLKAVLSQTFGFEVMVYPRVADGGTAAPSAPAGTDDAEADRSRQPTVANPTPASPAPAGPATGASRPTASAASGTSPGSAADASVGTVSWNVVEIPSGPADDGPGSGWDALATARDAGEAASAADAASADAEPATPEPAAPELATAPAVPERIPEVIAAREVRERELASTPAPPIIPAPRTLPEPGAPEPGPSETAEPKPAASARGEAAPQAEPNASPSWTVAKLGGEPADDAEPDASDQEAEPERSNHPAAADRYGESVIRELLSARFVGEEALPDPSAAGLLAPSVPPPGETPASDGAGPSDADVPDDFEAPPEEY